MSLNASSSLKSAIGAIQNSGALLVFPIDNRKEPASLWSHFFPRSPMRWEWDDSGDNRVADLWHLRCRLSTTGRVVYTKWFRGRATYFSKELFTALLRSLNPELPETGLGVEARRILKLLEGESPLSTKEIKRQADLQGRRFEPVYERAMRELWSRCLIVAYGEVDDGAFPSLAVGSTKVLFEELWNRAWKLSPEEAQREISEILPEKNLFLKHYVKLKKDSVPSPPTSKKASSRPSRGSKISGSISFEDL